MKILFLQIKGKSYGGVWQVNKTVGEALLKDGFDVTILSIRENHNDYEPDYNKNIHVETLNKTDLWESYSWSEIINELKKFRCKQFFFKAKHRLHNNKTLREDQKKLEEYIYKLKPDYIVSSQYQLLDMIPKDYLCKTYHETHCNFKESWNHPATRKTLLKYNNIVKYIWLCKRTMEEAKKVGLNNNFYIYNAVRFETEKISDVINNKKLVTIARISNEKRIDKMIDIVNTVFQNKKYKDWSLEIYGDGDCLNTIKDIVDKIDSKQIVLKGRTNDSKNTLLTSSINLITSDYEGFSLSILEANECGIPTIAFNFGESSHEEIIDGKTGFIVNDKKDYIEKLCLLMDNTKRLQEMSKNCKEFNNNFKIDKIVKKWKELFK